MALTSQQRIDLARSLAPVLYTAVVTAAKNHDDLVNAVAGVDNALDATLNQGVSVYGGTTTVINALASSVTAPAVGSWTAGEKATIGAYVLMKRAGLL